MDGTGKHHFAAHALDQDRQNEGRVTVAELVAQAIRERRPVRLAWPTVDLDEAGNGWPTGVLPPIEGESALSWINEEFRTGLPLLERILAALRRLD